MTMITPSYLGETIEYSSLHACRSTLEDPNIPILSGAVYQASRTLLDSAAWTIGDLAMAIIHKKWEAANASVT